MKKNRVKPTLFIVEDAQTEEGFRLYSSLNSLLQDFHARELPKLAVTQVNLDKQTQYVGKFVVNYVPEENS